MNTWYDYRAAWSKRPGVALIAVLGLLLVIAGIVGTIARNPVLVVFIPGLAIIYIHHLIAHKVLER